MNRVSIKYKLFFIGAIACIGFVTLIIFNAIAISSLSKLNQLASLSATLEADMLMLRRHEKDFLARKDTKYLDKYQSHFKTMLSNVEQLQQQVSITTIPSADIIQINQLLKQYRSHFLALAQQQKKIGLHAKDGLYGSLRSQVHKIETLINDEEKSLGENALSHSLMRTMLMLRRHEKDFMLRKQLKYVDKFNQRITVLESKLIAADSKADFTNKARDALKQYQQQFIQLSDAEKILGLDSKSGIHGSMRNVIHSSESRLSKLEDKLQIETAKHIVDAKFTNLLLGAALIVLTLCGIIMVVNNITRRVHSLAHAITNVTDNKDLSQRLNLSGNDEITTIANTFNQTIEALDTLMSDVHRSATALSHASDKLKLSSEKSQQGMRLQVENSAQLVVAMQQVSASAITVEQQSSNALNASDVASQVSSEGESLVKQNLISYQKLADEINSSSAVIKQLHEQSTNIGGMLSTIRGIADQTNLLALNAAIEAARAGEQGRGFAVVADEVRTLALRTSQSTQDIEEVVTNLKRLSQEAVSAMAKGSEQARNSISNSDKMKLSLEQISASGDTVNTLNLHIAMAAKEQEQACQSINQNMESISTITSDTSQLAAQVSLAGFELEQLSQQLGGKVQAYTLSH